MFKEDIAAQAKRKKEKAVEREKVKKRFIFFENMT